MLFLFQLLLLLMLLLCVFFLLAFVGKTSYSYSCVAFHNFGLCVCVRPQHTYYYIALRESRAFSAAI